jgi:hypothetical protein
VNQNLNPNPQTLFQSYILKLTFIVTKNTIKLINQDKGKEYCTKVIFNGVSLSLNIYNDNLNVNLKLKTIDIGFENTTDKEVLDGCIGTSSSKSPEKYFID